MSFGVAENEKRPGEIAPTFLTVALITGASTSVVKGSEATAALANSECFGAHQQCR
jgi:Ni/Fe-hydrogenase subunit HybB-like protein